MPQLDAPSPPAHRPEPKLLDRFAAFLDTQPLAPTDRTRRLDWVRPFILFHRGRRPQEALGNLFRHPADMGADEVRESLRSVRAGLCEAAFAQARDALLDFYAHVVGKDLRCTAQPHLLDRPFITEDPSHASHTRRISDSTLGRRPRSTHRHTP